MVTRPSEESSLASWSLSSIEILAAGDGAVLAGAGPAWRTARVSGFLSVGFLSFLGSLNISASVGIDVAPGNVTRGVPLQDTQGIALVHVFNHPGAVRARPAATVDAPATWAVRIVVEAGQRPPPRASSEACPKLPALWGSVHPAAYEKRMRQII